jgi:hypothetical protein
VIRNEGIQVVLIHMAWKRPLLTFAGTQRDGAIGPPLTP